MNLPTRQYSAKDLESARHRGQLIGWLQGAGVIVGGALLLKMLGWIPVVIVVGAVVYGLYRMLSKSSDDE